MAGPHIEGRIVIEVAEIERRVGAARPNRLKNIADSVRILLRHALPDAVDEFLAGRRAPCVGHVLTNLTEVCTVHVLQRRNVVHHIGLRRRAGTCSSDGWRCSNVIGVVHDGVFNVLMGGIHVPKRATGDKRSRLWVDRRLSVLQAERVPDLVQDSLAGAKTTDYGALA